MQGRWHVASSRGGCHWALAAVWAAAASRGSVATAHQTTEAWSATAVVAVVELTWHGDLLPLHLPQRHQIPKLLAFQVSPWKRACWALVLAGASERQVPTAESMETQIRILSNIAAEIAWVAAVEFVEDIAAVALVATVVVVAAVVVAETAEGAWGFHCIQVTAAAALTDLRGQECEGRLASLAPVSLHVSEPKYPRTVVA